MNKFCYIKMKKESEINLDDKKVKIIFILSGVVFLLLIVALFFSIPKPYESSQPENNTVLRVIDGDTFEYYDGISNKILKVRLLCVNTPEKGKNGYENATAYLRYLVLYREVTLNSSITDKDKYGRLLRFVYVNNNGDILFVNKLILDKGYGKLMVIPPEQCNAMK
jgi:endonuclease YncB( thermonuclease family)